MIATQCITVSTLVIVLVAANCSIFRSKFFAVWLAGAFEHDHLVDLAQKHFATRGATIAYSRAEVILHIGPNMLTEEDVEWYNQILAPHAYKGLYRLIFVEPVAAVLPHLRQHVQQINVNMNDATIVNALVCHSTGEVVLHQISNRFFQDFPEARHRSNLTGISSMSKAVLRESLEGHLRNGMCKRCPNLTAEQLLHSYTEESRVRCLTPMDLLAELQLHPQDVDMLTLDTEGYDQELVPMFMAIGGFRPALLQFEWNHFDTRVTKSPLPSLLDQVWFLGWLGYEVHRAPGWTGLQDLVAVLRVG